MQLKGGELTLEADSQKIAGTVYQADGNVVIVYNGVRMRADHMEYDGKSKIIRARGHVQFDHGTQHLEMAQGIFNISTGKGHFENVTGAVAASHSSNPAVLVSQNPISFSASSVERVDENTYVIRRAWVTVCRPNRPIWKFYAPKATIHLQESVTLENASFRLIYVPIIYLPYASIPAGRRLRQSGFLIPEVTKSSTKGYVLGDAFYWAPVDWMDATVGAQYFSRRGWSQRASVRMKPWENATFSADYFGVVDHGLPQPSGPPLRQGGHEAHLFFDAPLRHGWRGVADLDQLSSLTFRLAFSDTFAQAVNSEVTNTAFLAKNSNGFSLSLASLSYKNFLSASPDTSIDLRTVPEARAASTPRPILQRVPVYFSFDAFADGVHRQTNVPPGFSTPSFVSRMEAAPTVTLPVHFGPWISLDPAFTLRSTRYGGQQVNGAFDPSAFLRTTEEFSLDVQPAPLEKIFHSENAAWKHTIEPDFQYHYVNGVENFAHVLLFDEDDTLTDTNDIQYGFTQRLFRKQNGGDAQELVSWSLKQKYYFEPTFGGALTPGERNVFQALDSLTPFAFADSLHRFSPVISDLRVEPGGRFDTEFRVDYDPKRGQMTAVGTLLKIRPYRESFVTLAHFSVINIPPTLPSDPDLVEKYSNQVRAIFGYGSLTRRGWNPEFGFSYDISQQIFQNQIAEISYNGSCCGFGFEYRRLSLGRVRNENQFGFVFRIANIGSVGNIRRQESIF